MRSIPWRLLDMLIHAAWHVAEPAGGTERAGRIYQIMIATGLPLHGSRQTAVIPLRRRAQKRLAHACMGATAQRQKLNAPVLICIFICLMLPSKASSCQNLTWPSRPWLDNEDPVQGLLLVMLTLDHILVTSPNVPGCSGTSMQRATNHAKTQSAAHLRIVCSDTQARDRIPALAV